MNMHDLPVPVIELRLKYMGEQIVHNFAMYQEEMNGYVKKSIEALMTDDAIQREVDDLCHDCLKECIKEVFESSMVRRELIKIMTDQVLNQMRPPAQPVPPEIRVSPNGTGAPPPESPVITSSMLDLPKNATYPPDMPVDDDFWNNVSGHAGKGSDSAEG
jgi:hypothetical protein